jgi:cytochrome c1
MKTTISIIVLILIVGGAAAAVVPAYVMEKQNRKVAIELTGGDPSKGEVAIGHYGCSSCHTIPGIRGADAMVGPPLTKMGTRTYIGGVLKNTPDNMMAWLKDPPGVDAKTAMPNVHLGDEDARDIACYLYTLR